MVELELYASITEHDVRRREEFTQQFCALGIQPKAHSDKLEIRAQGGREEIMRLADLCESCQIHSVHISRAGG